MVDKMHIYLLSVLRAVFLLLFIDCFLLLTLFVGGCVWSLFRTNAVNSALSSVCFFVVVFFFVGQA